MRTKASACGVAGERGCDFGLGSEVIEGKLLPFFDFTKGKKLAALEAEIWIERVIEADRIVIYYMLLRCNFDAFPGPRCRGFAADDVDELPL